MTRVLDSGIKEESTRRNINRQPPKAGNKMSNEIYTTFQKLTFEQLKEIRNGLKSRRLKLTSTESAFKMSGAGRFAQDVKELFATFETSKDAVAFIQEYLDSIYVHRGFYYSTLTGESHGACYKFFSVDLG